MAKRAELRKSTDDQWEVAVERAKILGPLAQRSKTRAEVDRAAHSLGISTSSAYRMLALLAVDPRPTALINRRKGKPPGSLLLDSRVEAIITRCIEEQYLSKQKPREASVVADIHTKCWAENLTRPSRKAIHARIMAIDLHKRIQKREGMKAAEKVTPRPGGMDASAPNEIWLIDHTLADIILVDRRYRLPIGRPTITLVIDAFTRMCVGCYVSLGAPSTIQTAMALLRSFMPKEALLESAGVEWSWPCHGLPKILHSDNGRDFKSLAIRRGLDTYGVAQEFRPVAQPRYGAIIERFIGTMMGELHLVPGTTFSNIERRGEYDSDRRAVMTLDAFEAWVLLQISRYHRSPHRGIDGFTPISLWEQAVQNGFAPNAVPSTYVESILLDFLPSLKRTVSRTGITFKHLRYWAPWLGPLVRKGMGQVEIRYDPRDLSCIWVLGPVRWERVPLYQKRSPFTLREHELACADLRARAKASVQEEDLHRLRMQTQKMLETEARISRKARRASEASQRAIEDKQSVFIVQETVALAHEFCLPSDGAPRREVEEW